jgi:hypothetical protein
MPSLRALILLALTWTFSGPAFACAVCACGDPTLTVMGAEQPFAGRLRVSGELQHRSDRIGEAGVDQVYLREQSLNLGFSWAPTDRWQLSLVLPLGHRLAEDVSLAETQIWSTGDLDTRARFVAWKKAKGQGSALLGLSGGLRWPTAPLNLGADGRALPMSAQLGTGSVTGALGLWGLRTWRPWSLFGSSTLYASAPGIFPSHAGPSLRTSLLGQWQPETKLGFRFGEELRVDAPATEDGHPEPDTGGWISFTTLDLLWSPAMDLVVRAGIAVPTVQALRGHHEEGLVLNLGVAVDL